MAKELAGAEVGAVDLLQVHAKFAVRENGWPLVDASLGQDQLEIPQHLVPILFHKTAALAVARGGSEHLNTFFLTEGFQVCSSEVGAVVGEKERGIVWRGAESSTRSSTRSLAGGI